MENTFLNLKIIRYEIIDATVVLSADGSIVTRPCNVREKRLCLCMLLIERNVHFHECRQHDPPTRASHQMVGVYTYESKSGRVGSNPVPSNCAGFSRIEGPYANGRREGKRRTEHEKEFAIGRTLSSAPRAEFHDRVSGQQHAGTQATWGPPVLGPCQWHRPYRARSRSNRGKPSSREDDRRPRTEYGRPRSSPSSTG